MMSDQYTVRDGNPFYWAQLDQGRVAACGKSPASMALHELSKPDRREITFNDYQILSRVPFESDAFLEGDGFVIKARARPPVDLSAMALGRRAALLAGSDWTQVTDSPLGDDAKAAWRTYRQALRDITQQSGFPDVVWPAPPAQTGVS